MAIPTSRTKSNGVITISTDKCIGCGECVQVCYGFNLQIVNKKCAPTNNSFFGCIGCGHCMAICPVDAIKVEGRGISPNDLFNVLDNQISYNSLLTTLQSRRSIREFTDEPVSTEIVEKIVDAARTAPMGIPPSEVHLLVLHGREKVNTFTAAYCEYLKSIRWMVSPWFLTIMRPVWGKKNDELFRNFVKPLINNYINFMNSGQNLVTYDAPLAIYFYGSPYCDPADPVIAATYAMIAGESLGLGTCMLGAIHPMLQNGPKAASFRKQHGIRYRSRKGLFVVFGTPVKKFRKAIKRSFASVDYY